MTPDRFEKPSNITAGTNPTEVPAHISEVPYDKTSLDEAILNEDVSTKVDTGQLEAVQTQTYWSDRPPAKEVFPSTTEVESAPSHFRRNVALGTASLLVVGGAAAGVVIANNQPGTPNTQPSATGVSNPGETQGAAPTNPAESPFASPTNLGPLERPQPTYDMSQDPESVVTTGLFEQLTPQEQAKIKKYDAMSVEQFRALPQEEQLMYQQYLIDNNEPRTLYHAKRNGKYDDFLGRLKPASAENTGQEVLDQNVLNISTAALLFNKESFDLDEARKLLSYSINPASKGLSNVEKDLTANGGGLIIEDITATGYKKIDSTHMLVNNTDGKYQGLYALTTFKDISGKDRATWIQQYSISADDQRFDHSF